MYSTSLFNRSFMNCLIVSSNTLFPFTYPLLCFVHVSMFSLTAQIKTFRFNVATLVMLPVISW
jgi:hypothetical protein